MNKILCALIVLTAQTLFAQENGSSHYSLSDIRCSVGQQVEHAPRTLDYLPLDIIFDHETLELTVIAANNSNLDVDTYDLNQWRVGADRSTYLAVPQILDGSMRNFFFQTLSNETQAEVHMTDSSRRICARGTMILIYVLIENP